MNRYYFVELEGFSARCPKTFQKSWRHGALQSYTQATPLSSACNELSKLFGKFGGRLYNLCRGQDERPVNNNRIRKSVSTEHTFITDLPDEGSCNTPLQVLFADLERRIEKSQCADLVKARTMKIRFSGFDTTTVSQAGQEISPKVYRDMLKQAWSRQQKPVRLLGIGVQLKEKDSPLQSNLFE
jgi:DNA polymerase-4